MFLGYSLMREFGFCKQVSDWVSKIIYQTYRPQLRSSWICGTSCPKNQFFINISSYISHRKKIWLNVPQIHKGRSWGHDFWYVILGTQSETLYWNQASILQEKKKTHLQAFAQGARVAGDSLLIRRNLKRGKSSELF